VAAGVGVRSGEVSGEGGGVKETGVDVTQPVKKDKAAMSSVKFRKNLMVIMAVQPLFFNWDANVKHTGICRKISIVIE